MMKQRDWAGVFPALTTPFRDDVTLDLTAMSGHVSWLIKNGCRGVVALGSLGEASTLTKEEKVQLLQCIKNALGDNAPLIAGVAAMSTAEAVVLAKAFQDAGADGLMILPPYVYRSDWRETEYYLSAVFSATPLTSVLYNNPLAYGTDITPRQMLELREKHENFHAVKESSGDIRRISELRRLAGDALELFVGIDDLLVEGVAAGATGWIAGLVNAFPRESVRLLEMALRGPSKERDELYDWFVPLLRMDTVPKFVQLIKLVQQELGRGSERVRPPRLALVGTEREDALAIVRQTLATNAA
jgi:dihydrodipicolinate synthase/N-acetylneuraminate lyase